MPKPTDFFIGVVAFFAVLLPGTILTALIVTGAPGAVDDIVGSLSPSERAAAFVVASYVLGQVAYGLATGLDEVYRLLPGFGPSPLLGTVRSLVRAESPAVQAVAETSYYRWADAYVRLHGPAGAAEVDRLQAESKFFRTLTVVLLVGGVWGAFEAEAGQALVGLGLVPFTFWRFAQKRRKAVEATYRFFVMLKQG